MTMPSNPYGGGPSLVTLTVTTSGAPNAKRPSQCAATRLSLKANRPTNPAVGEAGGAACARPRVEMEKTIKVHDHGQPCEHGSLWPHWINAARAKWWQEPECLGGREMVLRQIDDGVWMEVREDGAVDE